MKRRIVILSLAALLVACAAPGPNLMKAPITPKGKIGVIEIFPEKMNRHQYGTLAGISKAHFVYDPPFDAGIAISDGIVERINAKPGIEAVPIPATTGLLRTTLPPEMWPPKSGSVWPELLEDKSKDGKRHMRSSLQDELSPIVEKYGVTNLIIVRPYYEAPFHIGELPGGYNFGIFSQDVLGPDLIVTFLFAAALVIDTSDWSLSAVVTEPHNAKKLEGYEHSNVNPPEDQTMFKSQLKELIETFTSTVANRISSAGTSEGGGT